MKLSDLPIPEPCQASRDEMRVTGLGRRFCDQCRKTVYNLSAMSERDARALVRERAGELCVEYWVDDHDQIQFASARNKTPLRTAAALALPLVAVACNRGDPAHRDPAAEHAGAAAPPSSTAEPLPVPHPAAGRDLALPASASAGATSAAAQSANCKSQSATGRPKLRRLAGAPLVHHPPTRPSAKPAGCDPPFTTDANGVKHPKPHCL